jgi:aerobic-type carbon monoxide dehydrogenase small subunit (CoxS/CutS family)
MTGKKIIELAVNGVRYETALDPQTPLLAFIRQDLGLKGTRTGCLEGHCGTCTVILDGRPVQSCNLSLEDSQGGNVLTAEAVAADDRHQVRQAFLDEQAAQCGYCTNGIIMTVTALVGRDPPPSRREILAVLDERHLCRCGAHLRILKAVDRVLARAAR